MLTSGGCDGCLNIHDPDNKGLEGLIANLEQVYQDEGFEEILSRYSGVTVETLTESGAAL